MNSIDRNLKFTLEYSREKVIFLDTTVHMENGELWTEVYGKSTDSHIYLHFQSAHLFHMKKSLPLSQFLRVKRICMKEEDFLRHSAILLAYFFRRGYPLELIMEN